MVIEKQAKKPPKGQKVSETRAHEPPPLQSFFARDKVGSMRALCQQLGSGTWEEAVGEKQTVTFDDLPTNGFQGLHSSAFDAAEVPCLHRPSIYPSETSSCARDFSEPGLRFKQMPPPPFTPDALRLLPPNVQKYYAATGQGGSAAARLLLLRAQRRAGRGRRLTVEEQDESCTRLLGLQRQRLGAEAAARRLEELAAEPAPRLSREEEALLVRRLYDERLLEQQHERQRMEQKHRPRTKPKRRQPKRDDSVQTFLTRFEADNTERAARRAKLLEKYSPERPFEPIPKVFTLRKAIELSAAKGTPATTKESPPPSPSSASLSRPYRTLWKRAQSTAPVSPPSAPAPVAEEPPSPSEPPSPLGPPTALTTLTEMSVGTADEAGDEPEREATAEAAPEAELAEVVPAEPAPESAAAEELGNDNPSALARPPEGPPQ
eukprot:EG_transcript_7564